MNLFGRRKKEKSCCCGEICTSEAMQNAGNKKQEHGIKILGSGCKKCIDLEKVTRLALAELQLNLEVEHVTDFAQIASYGVMSTPALVWDGKVVSYGKVLSAEEVKAILERKGGELECKIEN